MYPNYLREDTTYSLLLDGAGDYLDTGASFQSIFRGSFSVACWVKLDDGSPPSARNMWGVIEGSSTDYECSLAVASGGVMQFNFVADGENNGSCAHSLLNDDVIPLFEDGPTPWRHVVCVMEMDAGSGNSIGRLYVNGVKVTDDSNCNGMTKTNHQGFTATGSVVIGANHLKFGGSNLYINNMAGKVDEHAIWGEALDNDAVAEIYNQRYNSSHDLTQDIGDYDNSSDLVSYYRMNEGTGSTVADSEGSNNGTLVGDATFDLNSSDD